MREITIARVMNGYVVRVGCQMLVFETQGKMISELARFLDNPQQVEEEYLKTFGLDGRMVDHLNAFPEGPIAGNVAQAPLNMYAGELARERNRLDPRVPPGTGTTADCGSSAGGL